MATKLGRMITYLDGLLSIKSNDPLITWSCEITWQTKNNLYPLLQCLWPPNLEGCNLPWWSFGYKIKWPFDQYNKLNIFYIHYHNAYGHKTWQDDGLLWGDSTHNVICDEDSPFPDFWSLHHKWCQSLTSERSISARTPSSDVRLWHHWWCRLQKSGNGCPSSSYPVNFFKVELKDP